MANIWITSLWILRTTASVEYGSVDPPSVITTPIVMTSLPSLDRWLLRTSWYIISKALFVYVFPPTHGNLSTALWNPSLVEYLPNTIGILALSLKVITATRIFPKSNAKSLTTSDTKRSSFWKFSKLRRLHELSSTNTKSTGFPWHCATRR